MPGPKKGSGGRPRKKSGSILKRGPSKGVVKVSIGPKSRGKQVYKHRQVAGLGRRKGSVTGGTIVHHKNRNKTDNSRSNLAITTRQNHPKKHGKH